jgi:hypothetical protein
MFAVFSAFALALAAIGVVRRAGVRRESAAPVRAARADPVEVLRAT